MAELQHGFTTREEWYHHFEYYFQQIQGFEKLTDIKKSKSFQDWLENYQKSAHHVYLQNLKNNEYLYRHVYYFCKDNHLWKKEVADSLLSYLFRYCTQFEDVEAAYYITESLFVYYEDRHDEISIMKCILVRLICYAFLDIVHFKESILSLCKDGIELYERNYNQLNQEEKSMGLSIYDFESSCMYEYLDSEKDYREEFDAILYSSYVNRMKAIDRFLLEADMHEDYNKALPLIRRVWIASFTSLSLQLKSDMLSDKQIMILFEESIKQRDEINDIDYGGIVNEIIINMCDYHLRIKSGEDVLQSICKLTKVLQNKYDQINSKINIDVLFPIASLAKALDKIDVKRNLKIKASKKLLNLYSGILSQMPTNNYTEHGVDIAIYYYLVPLLKYNDDSDEVYESLMRFTALRQLQTAVHSVMVSNLAELIMSRLLEKNPDLIASAFHMTVSEVNEHAEEFLKYIKKAGLLHDVGKILCTNVINMQYRKLMDLEFETIKFHPLTSYEILTEIPALNNFRDIAAGHHENYDGIGGYPGIIDVRCSPQKIFIDLISICDSIDAATDKYGRNYTATKTLQNVMEEMNTCVGTRYSPELVDFISKDNVLQEQIEHVLSEGRINAYHYMYKLLIDQ